MKRPARKTIKAPRNCPVHSLASETEALIAEWNKIDVEKPPHGAARHRDIEDRLETIKGVASYTKATCSTGAAFQLILAGGEVVLIEGDHNPPEQLARRAQRLIGRALEYLVTTGAAGLPESRSYFFVPDAAVQS